MQSQDFEFCRFERDEAIGTLILSRPERLNALHPAAHHELDLVFDLLAEDATLRCAVVTGEGRAFCAGYDLRDNLETGIMEVGTHGFAGLTSRTDYPVPLIAAVNGIAFGGGFEIALACDLIIAANQALFALPEANVGWSPLAGGLQRLPRAIGTNRALDIALTGRQVTAEEGERMGFVSRVTTAEDLLKAAHDYARMIAKGAPLAIACNRQVVKAALDMPLADALDIRNFPQAAQVMSSEDGVEGKRAFSEKRAPLWKGC